MAEYTETSRALALLALLSPLVILAVGYLVAVFRRPGRRRFGLGAATVVTGLLMVVAFLTVIWAPAVDQGAAPTLYCDAANEALTLSSPAGYTFPQWARECRNAGVTHLVVALMVAIVGAMSVALLTGRRNGQASS